MQTKPLTPEQQGWLRINSCLPAAIIAGLIIVLAGIFLFLLIALPDNFFVKILTSISGLIIFFVLVASGIHIYNNYMDLRDGTTQVRVGRLMGKRETGRSPKTFYAEFENAGSVIVMGDVYEKLEVNKTYKVTYSPRTRRGWEVEEQA
ncbi:MAG: hypothetical protein OHK003_02170 [Anaerolineales bacterium]